VEKETLNRLRIHLRKLREICSLSQEDVAHLAGIDYKFYQSIEAGRKKELRVSTLERIAKAYGLQAYQLLSPKLPKTRSVKLTGSNKTL
jgi:transcriptional regulator with XRE-family HTH domain